MAIVKMNKLSVIGLDTVKASLMEELQRLGVVELNDQTEKLQDPEWSAVIRKDSDEDTVVRLEAQLAEVQAVLAAIARYDTEKKPLFAMRKAMTEAEYRDAAGNEAALKDRVSGLYARCEQWNGLKSEENTIVSAQAGLVPWLAYDLPLELESTRSVNVYMGVIPAVADAEALKARVEEASDATVVTVLGKDQEQQYLSVLVLKECGEKVLDVLKANGFNMTSFKGMVGTAQENMEKLAARLEAVKAEEKELEAQFAVSREERDRIRCYADQLTVQKDRAEMTGNLLKTRSSFYFDGWVPAESQGAVENLLQEKDCWYDITVPEKGEETPVLMKNNSLITPVEVITEMYSLPKSYEIDPTPIYSIFYIIFFGMMFADIAYGILLTGLCVFAVKKYKLEGTAFKLVTTLAYAGVSTAIWGVLFGGFFGDITTYLFGRQVIKPLWMDPLENAMFILAFSCILGTIHLFIGMGCKAYMQIRDGHLFDAICDVIIWYVFIIGLALLLFGESYLFAGAGTIGKWMAIVGAAWIVGCEFIRGKGITKLLGLWNLYGTTSYLADILSYSRLLALGLASAVIAQVFNMLGQMVGKGIVGAIAFMIVAIIGHTVNFAINALGSYVHASRLQYVEFFGKFYEGGGVAFKPFARKTKYIKIIQEEK